MELVVLRRKNETYTVTYNAPTLEARVTFYQLKMGRKATCVSLKGGGEQVRTRSHTEQITENMARHILDAAFDNIASRSHVSKRDWDFVFESGTMLLGG